VAAALAFWSLPIAVAGLIAWAMGERLRAGGAWAVVWTFWAILAVAAAALAPGVSYPLVVPVLVAGVAGNVAVRRGGGDGAALPPAVAAALLVFPMAWMLYTAWAAWRWRGSASSWRWCLPARFPRSPMRHPRAGSGSPARRRPRR
jgi:hypothetical protein